MIEFNGKNFSQLYDRGDRIRIKGASFRGCTFERCTLSLTQDISRMAEIRSTDLTDCTVNSCQTGPLIASEVTISNLRTNDLLIFWSPYLDRVTLSGEIGKIKINAAADTSTVGNDRQKPFEDYRARFYADVEWALDISKARFKGFDVRGIPGSLIRRDPESQVLITRKRALQIAIPGWERQLDSTNKLWPFMINLFLSDGDPDMILVAPLAASKVTRDPLLKGLQELRAIGLVEQE